MVAIDLALFHLLHALACALQTNLHATSPPTIGRPRHDKAKCHVGTPRVASGRTVVLLVVEEQVGHLGSKIKPPKVKSEDHASIPDGAKSSVLLGLQQDLRQPLLVHRLSCQHERVVGPTHKVENSLPIHLQHVSRQMLVVTRHLRREGLEVVLQSTQRQAADKVDAGVGGCCQEREWTVTGFHSHLVRVQQHIHALVQRPRNVVAKAVHGDDGPRAVPPGLWSGVHEFLCEPSETDGGLVVAQHAEDRAVERKGVAGRLVQAVLHVETHCPQSHNLRKLHLSRPPS